MKLREKYFLAGIIFIFFLVIVGSIVYSRVLGAAKNLSAAYIGSCSICNCTYEMPYHQVCIIRQGRQPACLICPKCQKKDSLK